MSDRDEILDAEDEAYRNGLEDGRKRAAADMRERAAKAVEGMTLQITGNVSIRDQVALTIRALPTEKAAPAGEG